MWPSRIEPYFAASFAAALKEAERHGGALIDGHVPPLETMFEGVYKDMPAHLREQMRQAAEQER